MSSISTIRSNAAAQSHAANARLSDSVVMSPSALVALAGSSMAAFDRQIAEETRKQRENTDTQRILADLGSVFAEYTKGLDDQPWEERKAKMEHMKRAVAEAKAKLPPGSAEMKTLNEIEFLVHLGEYRINDSTATGDRCSKEDFEAYQRAHAGELDEGEWFLQLPDGRINKVKTDERDKISAEDITSIQDKIRAATDDLSTSAQRGMAQLNDLMSKRSNMVEMARNMSQALLQGQAQIVQNAPR